jgi:hypothetical protein
MISTTESQRQYWNGKLLLLLLYRVFLCML